MLFLCYETNGLSRAAVDSDDIRTLRGVQLVYSNVEEPDSPRRRRGFQVWLQTLDDNLFPQVVRDEVESLLSGFHKPAKFDHEFVRRIFMPLDGDRKVMVAEARSNPARDKFNREGRFHSHALIFDAAEFRTVARNDPFAVFDGGFRFQHLPEDAERNVDWQTGLLPATDVPIGGPRPESGAIQSETIPSELLLTVAQWLIDARTERPVLALPFGPEAVEQFLRKLVALLPVEMRVKASFDTLWPGRGKYPPQIAGAGTAESLALWSYRQHSRFETRRQQVQPPIAPLPNWQTELVGHWHTHPDWTEEDREGSWALATWLTLPKGQNCPAASDTAMKYIGTWPLARAQWRKLIEEKRVELFPGELGEITSLKKRVYELIGGWSRSGLVRLREEIPIAVAAGWIESHLQTLATVPEGLARAVWDWQERYDDPSTERLQYICYRWIPSYQQYLHEKLRGVLTLEDEWIREYCRMTLPEELRTPAGAGKLLSAMLGGTPSSVHAQWFSSVFSGEPDTAGAEVRNRMNYLLAFDPKFGLDPLGIYPSVRDWILQELLPVYARRVRPVALDAGHDFASKQSYAISPDSRVFYLGYRVDFMGLQSVHQSIFIHLARKEPGRVQSAFYSLFASSDLEAIIAVNAPPGTAYVDKVNRLATKGKRDQLLAVFKDYSDSDFHGVIAGDLLNCFAASLVWRQLEPVSNSVFIGLVVRKKMEVDDEAKVMLLKTLVESAMKIELLSAETFEPVAEMPRRLRGLTRELFNKAPSKLSRDF